MNALQNLTQAITDLTATVDAVLARPTSGATEAQVQSAADAVNAQVARLNPPLTVPAS